jgi:hypothetical protein
MGGAPVLSRIVVILRTSDLPIGGLLFRIALRLFWKLELPRRSNGRPCRSHDVAGSLHDRGNISKKRQVVALVLSALLLATSHARAGILAATVSCMVVCIALRRYQALNIGKSLRQIRKSGTTLSPLLPIVGVLIAGLVKAGFEDWLFAMGYYLCIVFWGLAFVLVDYVSLPERGRNLSPGLAIAASASSIPL